MPDLLAPVPIADSDDHAGDYRTAIVDIGSNSIRLVVYAGARRSPAIIFNEKVSARLGSSLMRTGGIDADSMDRAMRALARFRLLIDQMQVDALLCVATAAVRDASNRDEFAERAREQGFDLHIISGDQEADYAAYGVISAIPDANGVAGDLGGGSLELVRVTPEGPGEKVSLPLGVLRVDAQASVTDLGAKIAAALQGTGLVEAARGQPFYMVGGSWRALARLDMHLMGYPLKVLHSYRLARERLPVLAQAIATMPREDMRTIRDLSSSRIDAMPAAIAVLRGVDMVLEPDHYILSSHGLREGCLYANLDNDQQHRDPLLSAAKSYGSRQSRFGITGKALFQWLSPFFTDESPSRLRLLETACHLADVAWQATPDFRAERGVEIALHGNWTGIDGPGRALVAQALHTSFGAGASPFGAEANLATVKDIRRAIGWGLAIRLGQRLCGGAGFALKTSKLVRDGDEAVLILPRTLQPLVGESVERRLKRLAQHFGGQQKSGTVQLI